VRAFGAKEYQAQKDSTGMCAAATPDRLCAVAGMRRHSPPQHPASLRGHRTALTRTLARSDAVARGARALRACAANILRLRRRNATAADAHFGAVVERNIATPGGMNSAAAGAAPFLRSPARGISFQRMFAAFVGISASACACASVHTRALPCRILSHGALDARNSSPGFHSYHFSANADTSPALMAQQEHRTGMGLPS